VKRSTIRSIIVLAALLLSALLVVQTIWVMRAYRLQETQVNYDITKSLKLVSKEIQYHLGDSTYMVDPVKQIDKSTFVVKILEPLDPYYAEQVLTREFKNQEINLDFEYNLYDCFNDSVIYTKAVYINQGKAQEKEDPSIKVNWKSEDGHYFSVYFPNKSEIVLGRLKFWFYSSLLLLIIVLFFAYTISVILRQKRLSEIKTDFINNMTHELKTPISTIALSSEVLMDTQITGQPDRLKNYAAIIQRENLRMQRQVEKVLQIASLEKDKVDLKLIELDVHKMIQEVISNFTPLLDEKNGHINTKLMATNCTINGDETHFSNIITNLIDNAIKYCEHLPHIMISTKNKNGNIIVEIQDNGIGLSPEVSKLIFDRFYRVPTGNVHNVKGFGLGLHYVKIMVEEHGGEISVKSKLKEGSTFCLKLPNK
tara:strand:+ start:391 stop:1665 length:1275 start_codon:yes stop_codon:yes gene_type:complete